MADSIGALYAQLSANTAQFANDLRGAKDAVNDNVSGMNKALFTLEAQAARVTSGVLAFKGAAAALGAGALIAATKAAIAYADNLGDTADKIGVNTDAFQTLSYAAKLYAVEQDALVAGLGKLNNAIGQASSGNKDIKKTFDLLGVSLRDSNGKVRDTADIFRDVADALSKIESPAQRAAVAQQIFGKGARELGQLLSVGKKAIQEYEDQARSLGLVLSKDLLDSAGEAQDAFDRLGLVMKTHLYANLLLIAKPLQAILDGLASLTAHFPDLTNLVHLYDEMAEAGKAVYVNFLLATEGQEAAINFLKNSAAPAKKVLKETKDSAIDVSNAFTKVKEKTFDFAKAMATLNFDNEGLRQMIDEYKHGAENADALSDSITVENEAIKNNIDLSTKAGRAWAEAATQNLQLKRTVNDVKTLYEQTRTPLEKYNDQVDKLNTLLADGSIDQDLYSRGLKEANTNLADARSKLDTLEGASNDVKDAFGDAISSMITDSASLSDALKALGRELLNIVLKRAVLNQIGDNLGTALNSGLGNFFGAPADASAGTGGGHAVGGPVFPSNSYLVGERGPEIFTPASAGHIGANSKLGGGTVYQIDARGADQGAVRRIEAALYRMAGPGVTERRVADAKARGSLK